MPKGKLSRNYDSPNQELPCPLIDKQIKCRYSLKGKASHQRQSEISKSYCQHPIRV